MPHGSQPRRWRHCGRQGVYPPDTAALRKAAANDSTVTKAVTDSADIFVIGPASTKHEVQLLSYPSRRDSTLYYKSRRIKVRGNADVGHVVRAVFFTTERATPSLLASPN